MPWDWQKTPPISSYLVSLGMEGESSKRVLQDFLSIWNYSLGSAQLILVRLLVETRVGPRNRLVRRALTTNLLSIIPGSVP